MDDEVANLIKQLKNEDEEVSHAAAVSLVSLGEPAIKPLVKLLKFNNSNIRWSVAWILDKLGWRPATIRERVLYYMAIWEWDEIVKLGPSNHIIQQLITAMKSHSLFEFFEVKNDDYREDFTKEILRTLERSVKQRNNFLEGNE